MATDDRECIVRPAKNIDEAARLWWPFMQVLGWNRAEKDIITHYAAATRHIGPAGWLHVASKSRPDEAQGCVVAFVFDNKTGWVGFFCVKEPVRGLGWGSALFKRLLEEFTKAGVEYVGLDGVEEQVKTYERRGFVDTALVRLMTRKGVMEVPLADGFAHASGHERLVPLEDIPTEVLVASDLSITGFERSTTWSKEALFDRDDAWGLALIREGVKEDLEGWILVRSCEHGFRFGPLYAQTKQDARFLLHQAMYRLQGSKGDYIAEVWPQNPAAVEVFEELGWAWCKIDYHRMWLNGNVPAAQLAGGKAEKEMFAIFDAAQS
ncbi:uncharacterized protein PV09_06224 [Verruconis gallopava]|uniref:N-acetyltransferase domain-containing protein n=1 Tax=Verruconis gallopava TaxID=253628 RepID=A0A0D2ATD1_9PEZI|nr:uncharacterized protein PV09_06224 [Verruconis gallopava]KIW02404.1 hypothetical protein PV09_06224 [Verruconis gallopava]